MITIKQIAVLAKVSPTTVSNVLHGKTDEMTPKTLKRVQRVIKENNYVSNMSGRSLAKYGSKIIAVVKIKKNRKDDRITHDPFFTEIIETVEHEVRTRGYFMMLYVSADVDECLRMAKAWDVEGMIICGCGAGGCTQFIRNSGVPVVFIDSYFHPEGGPKGPAHYRFIHRGAGAGRRKPYRGRGKRIENEDNGYRWRRNTVAFSCVKHRPACG
ncbi:MAG: LacI family transcriptional regulator [Treponema sp.]|nr:LacI family transcriptional regulator [Treponema sp.]